jgi:type IV pilus assembly protein PilF
VSTSTTPEHKPTQQEAAVANVNLAAGYIRQGKPEAAIEVLQRAIKQDPKLADAHSMIAVAYDQLGAREDAETHYKKSTQLEPDNSAAANAYAVFLCRQTRWKDAEPYFQKAVSNFKYQTPKSYTNGRLRAERRRSRGAEQNSRGITASQTGDALEACSRCPIRTRIACRRARSSRVFAT